MAANAQDSHSDHRVAHNIVLDSLSKASLQEESLKEVLVYQALIVCVY